MPIAPSTRELTYDALVQLNELLAELRQDLARNTETIARELASLVTNDVLFSGTIRLSAAGYATRAFHVPYGAVAVDARLSGSAVTISGSPSEEAPTEGVGVHIIGAGQARAVNLSSVQLHIWGAPSIALSVEVLTRTVSPAFA
jgi:hypothetical protein